MHASTVKFSPTEIKSLPRLIAGLRARDSSVNSSVLPQCTRAEVFEDLNNIVLVADFHRFRVACVKIAEGINYPDDDNGMGRLFVKKVCLFVVLFLDLIEGID